MAKARKRRTHRLNCVAVIGNYLPRKCGIATFTTDISEAISLEMRRQEQVMNVAMDDIEGGYDYPARVKFQVRDKVQADYLRAADFLEINQPDVVILQHEYGIYGGSSGAYILHLLQALRTPIITTLHTILADPSDEQRTIIQELGQYSERLVAMSHLGVEMLVDIYGVDRSRIAYIPHGIPDVPFVDPSFYKDQFNVEGRKVLLTFGLLSPGKGIEIMIDAMPEIVRHHPDAVYVILGATHPHIMKVTGDAYLRGLQQRVAKLGMEEHVLFHSQFVSLEVLCQYIGAADVYVTPYLSSEQIVSGTLAYTAGAGKAVVSTPYKYAVELLAEERGRLVPFGDSAAMAATICELLSDDLQRNAMRKRVYQHCRPMIWEEVAHSYLDLIEEARQHRAATPAPRHGLERIPKVLDELPEPDLSHIRLLTDDTGILQHATYATPNRLYGYSTYNNARALLALSMYYALQEDESVIPLIQRYLAFLCHAFNPEHRRFRDFMSYDRRWLEEIGSEDVHGRALYGLGVAVKCEPTHTIRDMAARLFIDAIDVVEDFVSPHALAYALIGLHSYLRIYGGDANVRRLRIVFAERILRLFENNADAEWPWYEDVVTTHSAKIPHALILAGRWIPADNMLEVGLKRLDWLLRHQTAPAGHLTVIGNMGGLTRHGDRASFDQLPSDVLGLIEACAEAFRATGDNRWLEECRRCLAWFLGRNDLNVPMYDFATGACNDCLQPHGTNANQGAEATLSWLNSLLMMYEVVAEKVLVRK
ncbi:MAG: glycosyltransferase family 4 protein [Kiritimatiellae bacterium]|nr:glycosyltransferase family 4 protein [Kiritimatiellia bacterium]